MPQSGPLRDSEARIVVSPHLCFIVLVKWLAACIHGIARFAGGVAGSIIRGLRGQRETRGAHGFDLGHDVEEAPAGRQKGLGGSLSHVHPNIGERFALRC